MRVAVRALVVVHVVGADAEVVVLVVDVLRGQALQHPQQVLEQQGLGFLDPHGHRGVSRDDRDDAVADAGLAYDVVDLVGDVQELNGFAGLECEAPHIYGRSGSGAASQLHVG